jgi:hypothetical protein
MRRLGWGLVAVAIVLGAVGLRGADAGSAPGASRAVARPPTRISLYGDSLAHQARPALIAALDRRGLVDRVVSTRPGAALCDDRTTILGDLLLRRPQVLVLEYSGNSFTGCMRDGTGAFRPVASVAWRRHYMNDLRTVLEVASVTNTAVIWTTAPPVRHPPDPENYPRILTAVARQIATTNRQLRVIDTGASLTSDGRSFVRSLPCRANERAFCVSGRIPVRAADGLHFDCHGRVDVLGGCFGYSAGGSRFGEALANATVAPRDSR